MNNTFYSRLKKMMAVLFVFILVMSLVDSTAYTASLADETEDEYEADMKVASWEELTTALKELEEESEIIIMLTEDIAPAEGMENLAISSGQNITIDLAGHTINRGLAGSTPIENGYVICVMDGGNLTLTDSTEAGGTVTGGANTGNGGGILCEDNSSLTVTNGIKITDNRAKNGAGICLSNNSELYLGSCAITKNDVTDLGGGIYGGVSHITFLGGVTKIMKNTKGGDENNANDLYMPTNMEKLRFYTVNPKNGKYIYSDEFEYGTKIGILLEEISKEISEGYGQCNSTTAGSLFFYNGTDYEISDDEKNSEICVVKEAEALHDMTKTTVEIYKGGKLKSSTQMDSFYGALDTAMSGSGDENVVVMGEDYSSDEEIIIPSGKKAIIDLNGHFIKRNRKYETKKNGGVFCVESGATLIIRDSHPKKKGYDGVKGGVITGGASSNAGGGVTVREKGKFILEGGTIYDCISDEDGGGVYVDTGSKETAFTMNGGRIYNCRTIDSSDKCYGGGVFFGDGEINLSNGTIEGCYSEDDGGAIYCKRGKVTLENMIFAGNKSQNRGGAIYIDLDLEKYEGTLFTAKGCTFAGNESMEDGGAFFMRDNPQLKGAILFDRCVFRDNKAEEDGGALVVFDDGMVLSNVEITDNTAGEYGGGVFVDSRYDISLKGVVVIKDNKCKKDEACNDLCLEDGTSTTAYVKSGGLVRGSWIGVGSTSSKSIRLSKSISTYEMKYFHSNVGNIDSKNVKNVKVKMSVTSSIFGNGRWMSIIIIGGAALIIMIALIIIRKRKQRSGLDEGGSV